ncbi:MAG: hypothetical protein JW822_10340 [Spirochaetales bacterium]|nr:hypothetical protein [Spirochaetales bacterium]
MIAFEIEVLNRRKSVNKVVRHIQALNQIVADLENKHNLADLLNEFIDDNTIEAYQVSPMLNSLLLDKYNYEAYSYNMQDNLSDFGSIIAELKQWDAVDMVIAYYHPELGVKVINPKRAEQWQAIQALKKNELATIYLGGVAGDVSDKIKTLALDKCLQLLQAKKITTSPELTKGKYSLKKIRKAAEEKAEAVPQKRKAVAKKAAVKEKKQEAKPAPSGQRRMTPLYSIPVTNELFHNGNVEAWKKVIQSYTAKYPGSDVYIFYEGERIHDVNALFKWGKVKHGSAILIAVAGDSIQDVAKLRRYLKQGASPMFEAFLRFPVNQVLNLF